MLSRLVLTFLPESKCLLISWLQSPSAVILDPKKIKSVIVSIVSPSICHQVAGLDARILVFVFVFVFFLMSSFKPVFHSPLSLSSRGSLVFPCLLDPFRVIYTYFTLSIYLPASFSLEAGNHFIHLRTFMRHLL